MHYQRLLLAAGFDVELGGRFLVLICRCAWHQRYRGYPLVSGVASWRGWTLRFTDGICVNCLARFRAEHRLFLERHRTTVAKAVPSVTAA